MRRKEKAKRRQDREMLRREKELARKLRKEQKSKMKEMKKQKRRKSKHDKDRTGSEEDGSHMKARKKASKEPKGHRHRRAATARPERIWDYGVIPYEIEANFSGR